VNSFTSKSIIVLAWVFALGLPILKEWGALCLLLGLIFLFCSTPTFNKKKLIILAILTAFLTFARFAWPGANIEEGHNAFLIDQNNSLLERELPKPIYEDWKHAFNLLYKGGEEQWAKDLHPPTELYAFNADSLWRPAKYSRKVDSIHFDGLYEFRGGFVNDLKYNFWKGEMRRRLIPFWVMYEFGANAVGNTLSWNGVAHQIDKNGQHKRIHYSDVNAYTIEDQDVGSQLYFLFLPEIWEKYNTSVSRFTPKDPALYQTLKQLTAYPSLNLHLRWDLKLRNTLITILSILMLLHLSLNCLKIKWQEAGKIIGICIFALIVTHAILHVDWGKNLGTLYPPHGGGDDGMVHDFWGVEMVKHLSQGNILKALEGSESIFYFTPGLRYFRGLEKIIFGSTNLGYFLFIVFYPVIMFQLFRMFIKEKWAWLLTLLFIVVPPNLNFSLSQYIVLGRLGYPAPVATALFIAAFVLWYRHPIKDTNDKLLSLFTGGVFLFLSVFMRPNNAIPVAILGTITLLLMAHHRQWKPGIACLVGMGTGLCMPLHNLYFGHEFHIITNSTGLTLSVSLSDYWQALIDFANRVPDSQAVAFATERLGLIFNKTTMIYPEWMEPWTPLGIAGRSIALISCIIVALYPKHLDIRLRIISWCTLSSFPFMLLVFMVQPRYISIGWDLAICVLFILSIKQFEKWKSARLSSAI